MIEDHPEVAAPMRALLQANIDEYRRRGTRLLPGSAEEIPAGVREQLRRLGYDH